MASALSSQATASDTKLLSQLVACSLISLIIQPNHSFLVLDLPSSFLSYTPYMQTPSHIQTYTNTQTGAHTRFWRTILCVFYGDACCSEKAVAIFILASDSNLGQRLSPSSVPPL